LGICAEKVWTSEKEEEDRENYKSKNFIICTIQIKGQIIIIIIIIITIIVFCHRPFLPGTPLEEPDVIPTAQASSFTLQYFPYYV